jgi:hypothetical protein
MKFFADLGSGTSPDILTSLSASLICFLIFKLCVFPVPFHEKKNDWNTIFPYSFVPFNNYGTNLTNFHNIVQTRCNYPSHLDIYYIHTTNNITNNNMAVALDLEIFCSIKIKKKLLFRGHYH